MGSAYFIVLERNIDGLDTMMDGKLLAKTSAKLDAQALKLGVQPITAFISVDPEQMADFMSGEGLDPSETELAPLQQFSAADGLATVRALLLQPEAQPAIHDLQNCERILTKAAQHGVGWHLEVDF